MTFKNFLKQLILAIIIGLGLTTCKPEEPEVDRNTLLINSTWVLETTGEVDDLTIAVLNGYYRNEFFFYSNNGVYKKSGKDHGSWEFSSSNTILTMVPNGSDPTVVWTILTLTKESLVVRLKDELVISDPFTKTFRH